MSLKLARAAPTSIGVESAVTTMTQPNPHPHIVDGAQNYYWVGLDLADGSFIQAGYSSSASCGNQWFYWAFTPTRTPVLTEFGSCGLTGARTFSLNRRQTSPYWGWNGEMSGTGVIGTTYWTSTGVNSGNNKPGTIDELSVSGSAIPSTSEEMPPMEFHAAVQYSYSGTGPYADVSHAVIYGYHRSCPPQEVFNDAIFNEFRSGTDYSSGCWATGASLW